MPFSVTTDSTASEEDNNNPPPLPVKQREVEPDYCNLPDDMEVSKKPPLPNNFSKLITKKVNSQKKKLRLEVRDVSSFKIANKFLNPALFIK